MAPPRKILRQQQEIMLDFVEEHEKSGKGLPSGLTTPDAKRKWSLLAKKLNAIPEGALKTTEGWKRYWINWQHKSRKKFADERRYKEGAALGKNRFLPLNDLEIRLLNITGPGSQPLPEACVVKSESQPDDDSDSDLPLDTIVPKVILAETVKRKSSTTPDAPKTSFEFCSDSPPPNWALELEQRRIAAQERIADSITAMAAIMQRQEERQTQNDTKIADALTSLACTMNQINNGLQETMQKLNNNSMPSQEYNKHTVNYIQQ